MTEPDVPQTAPYVIRCEPGTYAWCACGRSAKQPYCDGSHRGSEFRPILEEVKEAKNVAWCGCKQSENKPFCDGTHARLGS